MIASYQKNGTTYNVLIGDVVLRTGLTYQVAMFAAAVINDALAHERRAQEAK